MGAVRAAAPADLGRERVAETARAAADTGQRLSVIEKAGYGLGDTAANFVFQTMVMFQLAFYTDTFGITAAAAGTLLVVVRVWTRSSTRSWASWQTAPTRAGASSARGCCGPPCRSASWAS